MNTKSQAMIDQIRRLHAEGRSIKKIAKVLAISRNTVRSHLRSMAVMQPTVAPSAVPGLTKADIDWDLVLREMALGRPIKRIYEELSPQISYSQFTRHAKARQPRSPSTAIRLNHDPGDKTQVDYANGIKIIDPRTGKETPTQFFCGVLPHSSFTFGEFSFTQKSSDFLSSHTRMWAYFGGVTSYVVLDNLKSGVTKAHRYDPDLNPIYCDYANHYGFAALPARVRTPRDKAAVEATIGVIQRDFFDKHRATKFYSLAELNTAFRTYLDSFNEQIMPDYGVSRRERFLREKPLLHPIPEKPYEIFEFKKAKVHPDCCIELRRSVYSVPYRYVQNTVLVKFSEKMVVILDESATETLAVHVRQNPFKNSILTEHLPPTKVQLASFDVRRVKKFAELIGEDLQKYVDWQLELEADHPLRALRRLLGLIRFYESSPLSKEAMAYAARQAMIFRRKELNYFRGCATAFRPRGEHLHLVTPPVRRTNDIHVRSNQGE